MRDRVGRIDVALPGPRRRELEELNGRDQNKSTTAETRNQRAAIPAHPGTMATVPCASSRQRRHTGWRRETLRRRVRKRTGCVSPPKLLAILPPSVMIRRRGGTACASVGAAPRWTAGAGRLGFLAAPSGHVRVPRCTGGGGLWGYFWRRADCLAAPQRRARAVQALGFHSQRGFADASAQAADDHQA